MPNRFDWFFDQYFVEFAMMQEKLNTGDVFPTVNLTLVDGGSFTIAQEAEQRYRVVVFYRGQF